MRRATFADAVGGQGAAALNRVFQNYLVPMNFSAEQLELHMTYNDVVADASPLWFDDEGNVLAAALLAIRGKRGWIGGFGIAPEYREQGFAKQLLAHMISTARERDLESVALEVLQDNAPAIALYRAGGFETVRELHSFEAVLQDAAMPDGYAWTAPESVIEKPDSVRQCWQREPASLRNGAVSTAVSNEAGSYAAYRFNAHVAQVLKVHTGAPDDLTALSRAVAASLPFQRVLILNEPSDSATARHATSAGWRRPFKQYEMLASWT